jgi:hypothetical protein
MIGNNFISQIEKYKAYKNIQIHFKSLSDWLIKNTKQTMNKFYSLAYQSAQNHMNKKTFQ